MQRIRYRIEDWKDWSQGRLGRVRRQAGPLFVRAGARLRAWTRGQGWRLRHGSPLQRIGAALLLGVTSVTLLVLLVATGTAFHLWSAAGDFADYASAEPSRLYSQPVRLATGDRLDREELGRYVEGLVYWPAPTAAELRRGAFRATEDGLAVASRRFLTPDGPAGGQVVEIGLSGNNVARLAVDGREVEEAWLEPMALASYYGPNLQERRGVDIDALPEYVIEAVLAAEDDRFFAHEGISLPGIVRAAWTNLRHGEVRQGGSTITQQLVRNLYLSHRRTLARKFREAILALLVEARFDKRQILEAYLNEVYLGVSGRINVIGFGAASRAFFGKDAELLTLEEAALLAGMIQSPGRYAPIDRPEAAAERRDWVLRRMAELGWQPKERVAALLGTPVETRLTPLAPKRAGYFSDAMVAEAAERFALDDLDGGGYALYSTLDWRQQRAAEEAVRWGLEALEKGYEKRSRAAGPLQAALISVHPESGAIRAYVGGRDHAASQFDRVRDARRQAGSAFKPIVFATAFEDGVAVPTTPLEDTPILVRYQGSRWQPRNNDGAFRGRVTARRAMEQSLNIPAVRMAFATGLGRVRQQARELGLSDEGAKGPALALGAGVISPRQLATAYATFANQGLRPTLYGLEAVLDLHGEAVIGEPVPTPRRVLGPEAAALITSLLRGVIDRGTGWGVRQAGLRDPLAGKTGTSDGRRDSWFAGYSPLSTTVVWVGYDDDSPSRLSGSRGALPIWTRFTAEVRPAGGYPAFELPRTLKEVLIDPESGMLATDDCPQKVREVFPLYRAPRTECPLHPPDYWLDADGNPIYVDADGDPIYGYDRDGVQLARYDDGAAGWTSPGGEIRVIREDGQIRVVQVSDGGAVPARREPAETEREPAAGTMPAAPAIELPPLPPMQPETTPPSRPGVRAEADSETREETRRPAALPQAPRPSADAPAGPPAATAADPVPPPAV